MAPVAARVELANEIKRVRGGGLEMRGQLGDLVAQPVRLGNGPYSGVVG